VTPLLVGNRDHFERWRYCRSCGRRLVYSQSDLFDRRTGKPFAQRLSKRCPAITDESDHDWPEFQQRHNAVGAA
jgi:hypothetical protein